MSAAEHDRRLVLKVSQMFYRAGLSQTEIAERLRLSRFQVARLLRVALDGGYVTVKILEPDRWHSGLERQLEQRFGLRAAIVVDAEEFSDAETRLRAADAAGRYLCDVLADGDVLGISLGRTVQAVVDQLPDHIDKRVEVVQLIGGSSRVATELNSMILTADLARRFRCTPHLLFAPAAVAAGSVRRALLEDSEIKETFSLFGQLTIALLGIGSLSQGETSRLLYGGLIDDESRTDLLAQGAVGDVLSYVYDQAGAILNSAAGDRMIAISPGQLLAVPHRIAVATGKAKATAIAGALAGGLVNVLITDSQAAEAICSDLPRDGGSAR
jgi:DNA-binding transcriptional regulator LsrR (DeoR family)